MNLQSYTFPLVNVLAALTVVGQIIFLILAALLTWEIWTKRSGRAGDWLRRNALVLMFIVALTATGGSLFFSEIAGWNPCKLCWIQRIFMYPQVIILPIAIWKRDSTAGRYILALCVIGGLFAAWHYYIQMQSIIAVQSAPAVPCDPSGESCAKTPFATFGYITIPMMALTAFALNGLGSLWAMRGGASLPNR